MTQKIKKKDKMEEEASFKKESCVFGDKRPGLFKEFNIGRIEEIGSIMLK